MQELARLTRGRIHQLQTAVQDTQAFGFQRRWASSKTKNWVYTLPIGFITLQSGSVHQVRFFARQIISKSQSLKFDQAYMLINPNILQSGHAKF